MWKLKIAEGERNPWLRTLNNHIGKKVWEFDPNHSSDLLLRIQNSSSSGGDGQVLLPPKVKVNGIEDVTKESVTTILIRALSFYSSLQSYDGHWPGDYGGPMFLLPSLDLTMDMAIWKRDATGF
ncbi:hypothetical protein RIF29_33196 [Crotalaria pallida]|uniref:Cycloartenol synthase n=1 Tax=Crotalaria pallida TaxID=3830 RepID=A0AAN9E7I9_CROPI